MPTYVVSVYEKPSWRTLLVTKDKEKAEALYNSLIADEGVRAQIEEIPGKR